MTLLTFNSKYVVQSINAVTTTSASLQDDTQASSTFSLTGNQTVFVMYQANNVNGEAMIAAGFQSAISIDSSDKAISYDSAVSNNSCSRNCSFWIGTLGSGSHTVKGRFASNSAGDTVTISNRILLIYILNGDEFQYVDDATTATTSSSTLADDPNASVTFTPSGNCKALYLYNCSNVTGSTENSNGKIAAIFESGTGLDFSQAEKAASFTNLSDSVCTCYSSPLTSTSTTIKGRFASNDDTLTVSITRRQLGVLLLDNSTLLNVHISSTQSTTTSLFPVDDNQATINKTTSDAREILVIVAGTKRNGTSSTSTGTAYGISVDGNDKQNSRSSPANGTASPECNCTCWAEVVPHGAHVIQGRFGNNSGSTTTAIDSRTVIVLWLGPVSEPPQLQFTDNKVLQWVMS